MSASSISALTVSSTGFMPCALIVNFTSRPSCLASMPESDSNRFMLAPFLGMVGGTSIFRGLRAGAKQAVHASGLPPQGARALARKHRFAALVQHTPIHEPVAGERLQLASQVGVGRRLQDFAGVPALVHDGEGSGVVRVHGENPFHSPQCCGVGVFHASSVLFICPQGVLNRVQKA